MEIELFNSHLRSLSLPIKHTKHRNQGVNGGGTLVESDFEVATRCYEQEPEFEVALDGALDVLGVQFDGVVLAWEGYIHGVHVVYVQVKLDVLNIALVKADFTHLESINIIHNYRHSVVFDIIHNINVYWGCNAGWYWRDLGGYEA